MQTRGYRFLYFKGKHCYVFKAILELPSVIYSWPFVLLPSSLCVRQVNLGSCKKTSFIGFVYILCVSGLASAGPTGVLQDRPFACSPRDMQAFQMLDLERLRRSMCMC